MSRSGPKKPFTAYEGEHSYVFVSYAHDDARAVYPELSRLKRLGYRIWYDEGVHPGSRWSDELARRIEGCALFVVFITPRSVASTHCQDEVSFALDSDLPFLAVHLVRCELPAGLRLRLGARQAILRYELGSADLDRKLDRALRDALSGNDALPPEPDREVGGATVRAAELGAGDEVGPYRLLEQIGEGGMGTVFLAEQREPVERRVALKLVKLGMDTREVLARFEAERQALALMSHPNVAAVHDAGATPMGRPFFVMEYVPGRPITGYCDEKRLAIRERVRLVRQACAGVLHAHQKGIVHRDLKPGNILVAESDGRPIVKIIDFGVAKSTQRRLTDLTLHTRLGDFVGSPLYASPEQAAGESADVDTRADVYSLGAVLYELLVGSPPLEIAPSEATSQAEIQRRIRETDAPTPASRLTSSGELEAIARRRSVEPGRIRRQVGGDVAAIAMRAIEKDRERRYPSVSALSADLERFLEGQPVEAQRQTSLYRSLRFVRRHAVGVVIAAAVGLVLLGATGFSTFSFLQAERARAEAAREAETAGRVADFLVELFRSADPGDRAPSEVSIREMLDVGAEQVRDGLTEEPLVRATLMATMARAYSGLGLYEQAEALAAAAVEARSERLGAAHAQTLEVMGLRATALERAGALPEAEALARRMRELAAGNPALASDEMGAALGTLGRVLAKTGQFDEAAQVLVEALAAREAAFGPEDPELLAILSNLATTQAQRGRNDEAVAYLERALAIAEGAYGENHVTVAQLLHNLGILYRRAGRLAEAGSALERAYRVKVAVLGAAHPSVGKTLNGLGSIAMEKGDVAGAIGHYERALAQSEAALGDRHPAVANSLANLAEAHLSAASPGEAEPLLQRAIAIRRQLTPGHLYLGTDLEKLGDAQQALGQRDDARESYRQALEQLTASVGVEHGATRSVTAKLEALGPE